MSNFRTILSISWLLAIYMTSVYSTYPINDKNKNEKSQKYLWTVDVNQNMLSISLNDNENKYIYHSEFTSDTLQKCGFTQMQVSNLEIVSKFIQSARNHEKGLELSVNIEKMKGHNNTCAVIRITKNDDIWPFECTLKLKQTPRDKVDILEEHIKDLQTEISALKNQITTLSNLTSFICNSQTVHTAQNSFMTNVDSTFVDLISTLLVIFIIIFGYKFWKTRKLPIQPTVNHTDEIELDLKNRWVAFGDGWQEPKGIKIGKVVWLVGAVKGGCKRTVICKLPQGWRPTQKKAYSTASEAHVVSRINVKPNGEVYCRHKPSRYVWLDGIQFVVQ
eukprot:168889_1